MYALWLVAKELGFVGAHRRSTLLLPHLVSYFAGSLVLDPLLDLEG